MSKRVVTFEELQAHFRSCYSIDLYDVNSTHKHTGPDEPPYFNFWHFLLKATEDVKFKTTSAKHAKVVPMPTVDKAKEMFALAQVVRPKLIAFAKSQGVDPAKMALPSLGEEAISILEKIEADFGMVSISMTVDR